MFEAIIVSGWRRQLGRRFDSSKGPGDDSDRVDLLLVDDDRNFLELTSSWLRSETDFSVETTVDPEEALDLATSGEVDVVVSDYRMPGMDGLELLEAVKEEAGIPFVLFTGKSREEVAIEALNLGADRYVQKGREPGPQFKILEKAVRELAERAETERSLREKNALLENVFSTTDFGLAYLDTDFDFIRVNEAYAEFDDREPEFFPGRNHFDLYPDEENRELFESVVETGEPVHFEGRPFEYEGSPEYGVTYWDLSLQPVEEDGEVEGLLLSLVDVTGRERERQKLKQAEEVAEIGYWEWNLEKGYLELSDVAGRILEAPAGRRVPWEEVAERLEKEDRRRLCDLINGGGEFRTEVEVKGSDGEKLLRIKGRCESLSGGEPVRSFGTIQKATEG